MTGNCDDKTPFLETPNDVENGKNKDRPLLGQLLGLMSSTCHIAGATSVQLLQGCIPPLELNCLRFGGPLPILIIWGFYRRITIKLQRNTILPLISLSVVFAINNYTYFGAMEYIAVGIAESSAVSSTLIFTTAVSILFLKEGIGLFKLLSLTTCMFGVIFVIQPNFLFHGLPLGYFGPKDSSLAIENSTRTNQSENLNLTSIHSIEETGNLTSSNVSQSSFRNTAYMGYIMLVGYGLSQSATVYLIRGTTIADVSHEAQLVWAHILALVVSLLGMFIFEHPVTPPNTKMWLFAISHVSFSFLATVTYFVGLNFASGVLVNLNYSAGIVLSMLSQYFIVSNINPGHRNVLEIVGAFCTWISAVMNPIYQLIHKSQKS